jgi:hypothetical protein
MVIFNGYVNLPEGISQIHTVEGISSIDGRGNQISTGV